VEVIWLIVFVLNFVFIFYISWSWTRYFIGLILFFTEICLFAGRGRGSRGGGQEKQEGEGEYDDDDYQEGN
jgi:hypothetical protein